MPSINEIAEVAERQPHLADLPPTLDDSQTGTPDRRPGSVRRTATIDMTWPAGFEAGGVLLGRARDLLTPNRNDPRVLDTAEMKAGVDMTRTIQWIETMPDRPGIDGLVGSVGGNELRTAIDRALPGEREAATPLHLLLDDIAGTSLIAGFGLSRHPEFHERMRARREEAAKNGGGESLGIRKGRIICSGLRPEGWADTHHAHGTFAHPGIVPAGDITTDDPLGWHEWPPAPVVGMRRHRRIDIWRDGERLRVDAFFRDSCWEVDGSQSALHEYTIEAEVNASDLRLISVVPTPRVLPYPECKWAAPHAQQLAGRPITTFRTGVQRTLTELNACTHLNDMLRSLTEVPSLAKHL